MSQQRQLMVEFARRTGLDGSPAEAVRYLWTDAFAVCNFLGLHRASGEAGSLRQAQALVQQVHHVLGQHRKDDPRRGWISGLPDSSGTRHPTCGGLRIGKRLPERRPEQPLDEHLEWDRDGQYFHYLTKWMHALERFAAVGRDTEPIRWAYELAKAAHAAFVFERRPGGQKRMVWKMSIDLSYPLVPSMGHHDPLDGLITYQQIRATARDLGLAADECDLGKEITDMERMCEGASWQTADPLGAGCLLIDACRLAGLIADGQQPASLQLEQLLREAVLSLAILERERMVSPDAPAERRLAFREFGLSIGLRAVDHIRAILERVPEAFPNRREVGDLIVVIRRLHHWIDAIESFWLNPRHQQSENWRAHQDINSVMLATSLDPDGLLIRSPLTPSP